MFQISDTEAGSDDDMMNLILHDWKQVPGQKCIWRQLLSVLRGNATRKWLVHEVAEHLKIGLDASPAQMLVMVDSSPSAQSQLGLQPVLVRPLEHKESGTWLTGFSSLSRALKAVAKRISADPAKLAAAELQLEGLAPQTIPPDMGDADCKDALPVPTARLTIHFVDDCGSSQPQAHDQQVHHFMHDILQMGCFA